MPIYSSNRVSSAGIKIVAAEGYTEHDFGRILSECATNDMRLFNAAIARDFQEVTAMQEGTMVSSEIRALQEFSIKEAWKGLVEKLKKLWAKIKGVFRTVYAKLSLWLNRNNKMYVAQNRKAIMTKRNLGACKLPKYRKMNPAVMDKLDKQLKSFTGYAKQASAKFDKDKETFESELKGVAGDLIENPSSYYETLEKEMFEDVNESLTFANCGVTTNDLFNYLSGSSKLLKDLKKSNKDMDESFKSVIKAVNNEANKAEDEKAKKKYSNFSSYVSKYQTAANTFANCKVKLIKKQISNYRGLMAALVAYDPDSPKNENAIMTEFAFLAGYDALHEETEDMTPDEIEDEAIKLSIDISVDGAEVDGDVEVEDDDD